MVISRLTPLRVATVAGLTVAALGTQVSASGLNEFTLAPTVSTPSITTYQTQPVQTVQQPSYNSSVTVQTAPAQPAAPQFGELVFDSQPYLPNTGASQSGTIAVQPNTGGNGIFTAPSMMKPVGPVITN